MHVCKIVYKKLVGSRTSSLPGQSAQKWDDGQGEVPASGSGFRCHHYVVRRAAHGGLSEQTVTWGSTHLIGLTHIFFFTHRIVASQGRNETMTVSAYTFRWMIMSCVGVRRVGVSLSL